MEKMQSADAILRAMRDGQASVQAPGSTIPAFETDRIEEAVLEAYCSVLGVESVEPNSGFATLGGDSLRAVRVLSRCWRILGVELPVHSLTPATTYEEFVDMVREYVDGVAP